MARPRGSGARRGNADSRLSRPGRRHVAEVLSEARDNDRHAVVRAPWSHKRRRLLSPPGPDTAHIDEPLTPGLLSPCPYARPDPLEARHEVSPVPARESTSGEVLPGVWSPCGADLHEVS